MGDDMIGRTFGRLTVVADAQRRRGPHRYWVCKCDCGTVRVVRQNGLLTGNSKSCGCSHLKHGHARRSAKTSAYTIWCGIRQRGINPYYERYNGRGIGICDRWRDSFEAFLEDMGEPPAGTSLDRINNDGNYEPGNCRWATPKEQQRNKCNNRWVTVGSRRMVITDAAAALGVSVDTLRNRLAKDPGAIVALIAKAEAARGASDGG